jgi:hypothetical protein
MPVISRKTTKAAPSWPTNDEARQRQPALLKRLCSNCGLILSGAFVNMLRPSHAGLLSMTRVVCGSSAAVDVQICRHG